MTSQTSGDTDDKARSTTLSAAAEGLRLAMAAGDTCGGAIQTGRTFGLGGDEGGSNVYGEIAKNLDTGRAISACGLA